MRNFRYSFIFLFLFCSGLYAQSPVGLWKTISDKTGKATSQVKIWEQGGKLFGTITQLIDPDEANPKCTKCSGDYKDKPVMGMTILWNMAKSGDSYEGGQILDPDNGETYTCKIWVEGGNLKVRGYLGPFYRTQTWYRVQ